MENYGEKTIAMISINWLRNMDNSFESKLKVSIIISNAVLEVIENITEDIEQDKLINLCFIKAIENGKGSLNPLEVIQFLKDILRVNK